MIGKMIGLEVFNCIDNACKYNFQGDTLYWIFIWAGIMAFGAYDIWALQYEFLAYRHTRIFKII
jgi:hypothetical protein